MDYQVSARKFRPGAFEEVIGQPHVVQTLVNAIATKRIAHAFLFSGTRGVGKTTVARILAKALNCEQGPTGTPCNVCANCQEITQGTSVDVIEIDGASNTGVDDVREIRENVKFSPFRGGYRVYIIDEVHMLSNSAFNALLKTLEEPPAHVVFIFATTEIHKIPATILSRCQHYNFRRIPRQEIIQRLRHVAAQDGLTVEDRSLTAIARASEGSMRDALSLLDQAVAFGGKALSHTDLLMLLGSVPQEHIRALVAAILGQDSAAALRVIAELLDQGHDLRAYAAEVVEHLRNLLVAAVVPPAAGGVGGTDVKRLQGLMDLSEEEIRQVAADAGGFTIEQLQELFRIFTQAEDAVRSSQHPRFVLEAAAVRATRLAGAGGQGRAAAAAVPPQAAPRPPSSPRQADPRAAPEAPIALEWERVVERVTGEHPNIGAFLEQGRLVKIEGNEVIVGYPKSAALAFGRMQKEDNQRAVMRTCEELAGRPVRLRVVELAEGQRVPPSPAEARAAKEQDRKRALLDEARSHPVVKQAMAVFGAEVTEVRRAAAPKESE